MILAIPQSLTEAFVQIMTGLLRVVDAHRVKRAMDEPRIAFLFTRISAMWRAFNTIVDQLRRGALPPSRVRRADAPARAPSSRLGVVPPASLFPTTLGWLNQTATVDRHELWSCAMRLEHFLADPELRKVIEAAPQRAVRILRSLCWMLNVDHKGVLPPPPKRARRSRPRQPAAPHAAGSAQTYAPPRPKPASEAVPPLSPKPWP